MSGRTMRFGNSPKGQDATYALRQAGYSLRFSCTHSPVTACGSGWELPDDFDWPEGDYAASGWAWRRSIKTWVKKHGITDYRILRNTTYIPDLHGPRVYELWTKE